MAGSGEAGRGDAARRPCASTRASYIAVIEGAIPTGEAAYCTIGGRSALDIVARWRATPPSTIAVGACAWDGGWCSTARPAAGRRRTSCRAPSVVNLGGCPHNPANTVAVLVHYLTFGELPALDQLQPAAVRLRRPDPRPVRAPRLLRRRPVRGAVGRRGAPQGLLPLQDGLQGPGRDLQLPERPLERRHELADRGRPQLHRLRVAELLGHDEPVLRAPAERAGLRRRHDGRDRRARRGRRGVAAATAAHGIGKGVQGHLARRKLDSRRPAKPAPRAPAADSRRRRSLARIKIDPVTRIEGHLRIEAAGRRTARSPRRGPPGRCSAESR